MGKALLITFALLALILVLAGRGQHAPERPSTSEYPRDERLACTLRGVDYFKAIGSWPLLSDGRDAYKEAEARCGRSLMAFPEVR